MAPSLPRIAYVTDLEGQWERFVGFVEANPDVRLEGETLVLADGVVFVFGGDAVDRGPWSRRLVRVLLEAKERYGERVVLLAGNRDVNKLRLVRELGGFMPERVPLEHRGDRPTLLRWIFEHTMGAADAFAHRVSELRAEGEPHDDETVVESFLRDLEPDGLHARYLSVCQLAHRHGPTLFLHGGLTEESLGYVPGAERIASVDAWVEALNAFYRGQLERFRGRSVSDLANPPWADVVAYQAPFPGKRVNPRSVVYGRLADELNNSFLPSPGVIAALRAEGIGRLILGHTPSGDTPSLLRTEAFELVVADNSRGRVATGSSVALVDEALLVRGRAVLDSGEVVDLEAESKLDTPPSDLGLRTRDTGSLVKGRAADGRFLLYRGLPGYVVEQVAVDEDELRGRGLEPPHAPPST